MSEQPSTVAAKIERPPWSPLAVTLLTLVFPGGGAVVTVQNLQRLGELDAVTARRMALAVIAIFSIGLASLLYVAGAGSLSKQPNATTSFVIDVGAAVASYLAQRGPYRRWHHQHAGVKTGRWLSALLPSLVYEVLTFALAAAVFTLLVFSFGTSASK